MDINGRTQIYGIFGSPIEHTLSPRLHNTLFNKLDINAVYLPFDVKPDSLPEALDAIRSLNISGINVTLPHKENALKYLDTTPSEIDRMIGAVNTVWNDKGRLCGYNTDGPGFIGDLQTTLKFDPQDKRILMVGAGGAARAVAAYLLKAKCRQLLIYNRTPDRANGLAEYLKNFFKESDISAVLSVEEVGKQKIDLLVNASSCGMKTEDPFPINPEVLTRVSHVYDLIYHPVQTKLLREAKRCRLRACGGTGMLIQQAAFAQGIWFPLHTPDKVLAILRNAY